MSDASTTDRHVRITRTFAAPREAVFRAWTVPDELAAWYGPNGFDAPGGRVHIDLRVGGRIELTMVRSDGGGEIALGYDIIELTVPELLVLRSDPMPAMGIVEPTIVRIELDDLGDETRMTLTDGPLPRGGAAGAEAGYGDALDKLARRLAVSGR